MGVRVQERVSPNSRTLYVGVTLRLTAAERCADTPGLAGALLSNSYQFSVFLNRNEYVRRDHCDQ